MSKKAIPGAPYTIVKGDTLWDISKQAYGNPKRWREIYKANQTTLRSGNPNLIYPGEIIQIPGDAVKLEAKAKPEPVTPPGTKKTIIQETIPTIPNKAQDDFTIIVAGQEIPVMSGSAFRAINTGASGWAATIRFDPDEQELAQVLTPYTYPPAQCFLGGEQIVDGVMYSPEFKLASGQRTATLEGFSPTVDLIDSTPMRGPFESKNITLEQRATELVEPLGIRIIFNVESDERFDRVSMEPTETIFTHLAKLASQRGILITSTELGTLKFTKATTGQPVGTIEEGESFGMEYTAKFNGRSRFNVYKVLAQTPARKAASKSASKEQIAKDELIPKSRSITFTADETTGGEMKNAAAWKRSRQLAEAMAMDFPVSSWYGPDGKLWKENTIVTVKSKTMYIPDGFDFLIKSVEYVFETGGTTATLGLIPPQVYTGEPLDEPWAPAALRQKNRLERLTAGI